MLILDGNALMKISHLFLCGAFSALVLPCLAQTTPVAVTNGNSSLSLTRSAPQGSFSGPQSIEWLVDGRRILVYPSEPSVNINASTHLHSSGHIEANQLHVQGYYLGHETSPNAKDTSGSVTGGIVYTVAGGAAGSGSSRIYEKVDIFNRGSATVSLTLSGLGRRPGGGAEIPDLNGLEVNGTTIAFIQGNGYRDPQGTAHSGSILDYPLPGTNYTSIPGNNDPTLASVTVLPALSFSGFNTFNQPLNLQPGATLTMVTELNVKTSTVGSAYIEGESYTASQGVAVENTHLASLDNGDWAGYSLVNFGTGANVFEALVAVDPAFANQKLEVRLGSPTGTKDAELSLLSTGGFGNFQLQSTPLIQPVSGSHDVYLVPIGRYGAGNIDKFRFIAR